MKWVMRPGITMLGSSPEICRPGHQPLRIQNWVWCIWLPMHRPSKPTRDIFPGIICLEEVCWRSMFKLVSDVGIFRSIAAISGTMIYQHHHFSWILQSMDSRFRQRYRIQSRDWCSPLIGKQVNRFGRLKTDPLFRRRCQEIIQLRHSLFRPGQSLSI